MNVAVRSADAGRRSRTGAPDALVFDMDGLLLDTERISWDAFEEACQDAGWPSPELAIYARCIAGLDAYFPVRVTGDMVRRGKPDPEPDLVAAERLGADPARCWALEDSANGVRSACAAGFEVFQVPDLVAPPLELRRLGHTVLDALYDAIDELRVARSEA